MEMAFHPPPEQGLTFRENKTPRLPEMSRAKIFSRKNFFHRRMSANFLKLFVRQTPTFRRINHRPEFGRRPIPVKKEKVYSIIAFQGEHVLHQPSERCPRQRAVKSTFVEPRGTRPNVGAYPPEEHLEICCQKKQIEQKQKYASEIKLKT
ncbi:MAG: hypothetical protein QMD11_05085 [Smithella sp.]|nr:hypothetical protein [Smithella sp.]